MVAKQILHPDVSEPGVRGFESKLNSQTYKSFRSQVGFELKLNKKLQPFFSAMWEHEFSDRAGEFDAQFLDDADTITTFNIIGQTMERDAAVVQAGFRMVQNTRWNLSAFYEGRFSTSWYSNSGNLAINVAF